MERLCPILDLGRVDCACGANCLFNAKQSDLVYFRKRWFAATKKGDEERFLALQEILTYREDACDRAVHLITGQALRTIAKYREYASLGELRRAHGNVGRAVWNASAPWLKAAIWDTLQICTWPDPSSGVRRPVNNTVAGMGKMHAAMMQQVFSGRSVAQLAQQPTEREPWMKRVEEFCSISAFARGVTDILQSEGCRLLGASTDHNKCPYCLEMEASILSTHTDLAREQLSELPNDAALAALTQAHTAALEDYRKHMAKDFATRHYINRMTRVAHALNAVYDNEAPVPRGSAEAEAAWEKTRLLFGGYVMFTHLDDRSDYNTPSPPVQTETVSSANPQSIHGQHDHGPES